MAGQDPFDLERFVEAQATNYADAICELRRGRKTTHWMWYVFPQLKGLGFSAMAQRYAIGSRAEAIAYLAHPVLGLRLRDCVAALLATTEPVIHRIMGSPDDMKLCSSMTLFAETAVDPADAQLFRSLLDRFYAGSRDAKTQALLAARN
ncbi:MAG: DUF1810 domain-containing protein [Proteobacteria bacterium]|nr:DUF1810 domain-containing protein [Pseudomonadota bacterium]